MESEQTAAESPTPPRFLSMGDVVARTRLSRATIYQLQGMGEFPRGVKMTKRAVRWIESEVNDWVASRIATRGGT